MTDKQTNDKYIEKFIESMENDFKSWKMNHCAGPGMSWTEYHSPEYSSENGRVSFGFSLTNHGAWVNGYFRWNLPMMNPFSKRSRRFRKAKRNMEKYLNSEEHRQYLNDLNAVID